MHHVCLKVPLSMYLCIASHFFAPRALVTHEITSQIRSEPHDSPPKAALNSAISTLSNVLHPPIQCSRHVSNFPSSRTVARFPLRDKLFKKCSNEHGIAIHDTQKRDSTSNPSPTYKKKEQISSEPRRLRCLARGMPCISNYTKPWSAPDKNIFNARSVKINARQHRSARPPEPPTPTILSSFFHAFP